MAKSLQTNMQALWDSSYLDGGSAAWLEGLYERYLEDPGSVDERWRSFFDSYPVVPGASPASTEVSHAQIRDHFRQLVKKPINGSAAYGSATYRSGSSAVLSGQPNIVHERKQVSVLQLLNAYRFRGHQNANLNPLNNKTRDPVPELSLAYHDLAEADYDTVFNTGSLQGPSSATLREIHKIISSTYCGSIGAEYMHISGTEEKRWIQKRLEPARGKSSQSYDEKRRLLSVLTAAEGLEHYLHKKYVGQKRFSLEGGETLIPVLAELIQHAGKNGVKEVAIGMAHRGRLNVLVNIMGKRPGELFQEFEGIKKFEEFSGDVKYHLGFSSDYETPGGAVHIALGFNPSHLEIVSPVVEGSVRARQDRRKDAHGDEVLPLQVHGDAAFSGQGVVMETMQMSQSRGFSTKGTVHVIINNQIGFTTSNLNDARSTTYCTDIIKMVDSPVFHVNADDPEAAIEVARIALDYRKAFRKDVVIDLVCYRRHGHNEADEPSVTQPMMYKSIRSLPTTCELYSSRLITDGIITSEQYEKKVEKYRDKLDAGDSVIGRKVAKDKIDNSYLVKWAPYKAHNLRDEVDTSVDLKIIQKLSASLDKRPEGFELQSRVDKIMSDRNKMAQGALPLDWGYAEIMAYATLVYEDFNVRLSGQDSGRGTFFHRHAVLHNQVDGGAYVPLRNIAAVQGNFLVIDSLLSELAVLAFEYGYSTADPTTLVIWEAQFGDFANGAQMVIDQFITAGEHKWGRLSGLTMFLPHGFEGQGAEHSSARLERFLQSCSEQNIQVCVPSTPAQIFHLLRRQLIRKCRKPLIVMTPKSLLRHKLATSDLEDLSEGKFNLIMSDSDSPEPVNVKKVLLCSGKLYYDLLLSRREQDRSDIAIIRIEQLYPFPSDDLNVMLKQYTGAKSLVWCQEEPKNQGAWDYCKPRIIAMLDPKWHLSKIARESSSAPAVGSAVLHTKQQQAIIEEALSQV